MIFLILCQKFTNIKNKVLKPKTQSKTAGFERIRDLEGAEGTSIRNAQKSE